MEHLETEETQNTHIASLQEEEQEQEQESTAQPPLVTVGKKERKNAAAKEEAQPQEIWGELDVYEYGFKMPLQLHPQHENADAIAFLKGNVQYRLKPDDILTLANTGKIVPGNSVGKLPWSAAIGLLVNNLDGGRNKAFSDILKNSKQNIITKNLD